MHGSPYPYAIQALAVTAATLLAGRTTCAQFQTNSPPVTFAEAWRLTESRHPLLKAAALGVAAADARCVQAAARPNPSLGVELENAGGSGALRALDAAETTLALTQPLERGGKRAARQGVAYAEGLQAVAEAAVARAAVWTELAESYVDALAAEAQRRQAVVRARLGAEFQRLAGERVTAGKGAALEAIRAEAEAALDAVALAQAELASLTARRHLASYWGEVPEPPPVPAGDLADLPSLPPYPAAATALARGPSLAVQAALVQAREAELRASQAESVSDLEVGAGFRRFEETGDHAWVASVSVPLPLFDRRRGARLAAGLALDQARQLQAASRAEAGRELAVCHAAVAAARAEAVALRDTALPATRRAYETALAGYGAGKFGQLDVLEAQRACIDAEDRLLTALTTFHKHRVALAALTGELSTFHAPLTQPTTR